MQTKASISAHMQRKSYKSLKNSIMSFLSFSVKTTQFFRLSREMFMCRGVPLWSPSMSGHKVTPLRYKSRELPKNQQLQLLFIEDIKPRTTQRISFRELIMEKTANVHQEEKRHQQLILCTTTGGTSLINSGLTVIGNKGISLNSNMPTPLTVSSNVTSKINRWFQTKSCFLQLDIDNSSGRSSINIQIIRIIVSTSTNEPIAACALYSCATSPLVITFPIIQSTIINVALV